MFTISTKLIKLHYLVIPLVTLSVAIVGGFITKSGMSWYKTIKLPKWTPPGKFIGTVWTIIFILSTISAIIFWNNSQRNGLFWFIFAFFVFNAVLNVLWSFLFFRLHLIGESLVEVFVLGASVAVLIISIWPVSKIASILLFPYLAWLCVAGSLNYKIYKINRLI